MLNVNDGTLDAFVVAYCEAQNYECDGGVFGLMFSGKEDFTETEARNLIDQGAAIYQLDRAKWDPIANELDNGDRFW